MSLIPNQVSLVMHRERVDVLGMIVSFLIDTPIQLHLKAHLSQLKSILDRTIKTKPIIPLKRY